MIADGNEVNVNESKMFNTRLERDTNHLIGLDQGHERNQEEELGSENAIIESHDSDSSKLLPNKIRIPGIRDHFNFVSITFLLLGLSTLMPWSFFITASDYWMYKFRNTSLPYPPSDPRDRTFLQTTYASWISIASNIPAFLALLLNTKLLKFSELYRNGVSQIIIILLFVATTILVFLNSDQWQYGFFAVTIATIVFMNVAGAIFQAGVVGIAALFPKKYMHSMVTGQGLAGVFAAVAQILALLEEESPIHTAMTFFLSALSGLVLAFMAYCAVHKTKIFNFYTNTEEDRFDEFSGSSPSFEGSINLSESLQFNTIKLTKQIWACALSVFLTFVVTMSIFPGITTLVVSQNATNHSAWTGRMFLPLCFLLYGAGDFCGRLACGFLPFSSVATSKYNARAATKRVDILILGLSILRVLLIPAFMLCNAHPRSGHLPVLFPQDQVFIALITILGFSNGFCFCAPMMVAPVLLPIEYRERVGNILTICLLAGLSLGSLLSFPLISCL